MEIDHYLREHALIRFYQHKAKTHPEHQKRKISSDSSWSWSLSGQLYGTRKNKIMKELKLMETKIVFSDNTEIKTKIQQLKFYSAMKMLFHIICKQIR